MDGEGKKCMWDHRIATGEPCATWVDVHVVCTALDTAIRLHFFLYPIRGISGADLKGSGSALDLELFMRLC